MIIEEINLEENILLIGHCESPKFYLQLKKHKKYRHIDVHYKIQYYKQKLDSVGYDWIILNGGGVPTYQKITIASNGGYIEIDTIKQKENIYLWKKI